MKENKVKNIIISGIKSVCNLPAQITEWLDYFIEDGWNLIISGDSTKNKKWILSNCESVFLIRNGESRETKLIVEELRRCGMPIFIYRTDLGKIRVFRKDNNREAK